MNPLASSKQCVARLVMAVAAFTGFVFLTACSSNNNAAPNNNGFTNGSFSGTYVVAISGTDAADSSAIEYPFAIVGTVTADGNGNITGGTVDIVDGALGGVNTGEALSKSTYSVSSDGRGQASFVTAIKTFTVDFVLTSTDHGLITRFDNEATGSGTLDIEGTTTQSALTSFAFSFTGADPNGSPLGLAGAFTLNSSGTITTGVVDENDGGGSPVSGTTGLGLGGSVVVGAGGSTASAALNSELGDLTFDVWVIDATHLKFIETDLLGNTLAGDAFSQGSFAAGQVVYTLGGEDISGDLIALGGYATTDASGDISSGIEDYYNTGLSSGPGTVNDFTASCSTFTLGRCQWATVAFINGVASNLQFAAYPYSSDGVTGVLMLEDDSQGFAQGSAFNQSSTAFTSPADYALNLSGFNGDGEGDIGEVDDIAQFNATTASSSNMSGVLDENSILGGPVYGSSLLGTYTPDSPATGRGGMSVTTSKTFIGGLTLEYYTISASAAAFIELDSSQISVGTFEAQTVPSSGVVAQATKGHVTMVRPIIRRHAAAWPRAKANK